MAATSVVVLDRGNNTTCTVNLFGATVVSWRVNNQEQLFVSKQAVFDGKRAIRGGIPFVFPQFGQWAFGPQHGFARIARWHVEKMPERLPSGDVEAVFSLMDDDFTRSMWHFQFRLTYRLILREKELHFNIGVYNPSKELTFSCQLLLHTYFKVPDVRRCQITGMHGCMFIDKELHFNIGVYNPSKELTFSCQLLLHTYFKVPDVRRCQITGMHGCMFIDKELHFNIGVYNPSKELTFSCQLLLHTYFKVPDVRRCQITGMHGCMFIDKTREGTVYQEGREVVTISEWTDRIYQNTMQEHIITNVVSGRKMRIQKYNFPDTVIWNPWSEYAKEIPDFGDDEFPNMVCVEAGRVATPIVLLPGTAFEASQILQVM
ncbi:hypothetical protein PYW07_007436 [Mythimna separata]|uniref:Galactose mutarotase n=1 Tax=Mythimna separata TaxID=271217 RepID=A0AAD7Z2Z7_MYTSE|nr:hypothetical protein PYW07_007436 [Mythimna separata]